MTYQQYCRHIPTISCRLWPAARVANYKMDETNMQLHNQTAAKPPLAERRRNTTLREHFDTAQALLKPLLGNPESHNGTAFYRAMTQLQATFPDMSENEIEALVAAVVRSVQTRPSSR